LQRRGKPWLPLLAAARRSDAVTVAVMALEDNPAFNAGTGAVLTRDGSNGGTRRWHHGGRATLEVGAVAGVRRIKNPILLARAVLASPQVLLSGAGAERRVQLRARESRSVIPQCFVNDAAARDGRPRCEKMIW
jgi:isoaspartyl peptidase/L-asparaginase-like protein (Ntn-hydrolase superfamily)